MYAYENICRQILNDTVKNENLKEKLTKAKQTEKGGGTSSKYIYKWEIFFKQFEYIPDAT